MNLTNYNPHLPHACSHNDYLLASCFGLVDPWTEDAFEVVDFTVFPHGVFNDYGMEILTQALASGWNDRHFFFYKRLGVNWLNDCIDDLVKFSNLTPIKDSELSKLVIEHLRRVDPETPDRQQQREASEVRILGGRGNNNTQDLEKRRDILFRYSAAEQSPSINNIKHLTTRTNANSLSDFRDLDLESVWERFSAGRIDVPEIGLTSFEKCSLVVNDLQRLSESEFHQEFCAHLMNEEMISTFRELISSHGVHVGEWYERAVWPRVLRNLNKNLGDDNSFVILYEQAYGHFNGKGFSCAGSGAGASSGSFTILPGQSKGGHLNIKAEKTGSHQVHFTGYWWPGGNKDMRQPISLTHPFRVLEPSKDPLEAPKSLQEPTPLPTAVPTATAVPTRAAQPAPPHQQPRGNGGCSLSPPSGAIPLGALALAFGVVALAGRKIF